MLDHLENVDPGDDGGLHQRGEEARGARQVGAEALQDGPLRVGHGPAGAVDQLRDVGDGRGGRFVVAAAAAALAAALVAALAAAAAPRGDQQGGGRVVAGAEGG